MIQPQLMSAILNGNTKEVQRLLMENAEIVTHTDEDGFTPLHHAIITGNLAVVQLLHRCHACLLTVAKSGHSPLYTACCHGHMDIIKYIFMHMDRKLADQPDNDGMTPLMAAVLARHNLIVDLLIRKHVCNINATNKKRQTSLHLAVNEENTAMVRILVRHGATVDRCDDTNFLRGETPLMYAAKLGQSIIAEVLLHHGADVTKLNKYGDSSLTLGAEAGHSSVVSTLLTASSRFKHLPVTTQNSPLVAAMSNGHVEVVDLLLRAGWTYNIRCAVLEATIGGHTRVIRNILTQMPLLDFRQSEEAILLPKLYQDIFFLASLQGHSDIVKLMLGEGVDVDGWTPHGMRAIHEAVRHRHSKTVLVLLNAGANIFMRDKVHGLTPFLIAAILDFVDIMHILLNHAEKLSLTSDRLPQDVLLSSDQNEDNALHFGVCKNHNDVVKFMLEKACDVNLPNSASQTPLHLAVLSGNVDITNTLLVAGSNSYLRNKNGETPLYLSVGKKSLEIVWLLLDHLGCLSNQHNPIDNYSVLQYAAKKKKFWCCSMLLAAGAGLQSELEYVYHAEILQNSNDKYQILILELWQQPMTLSTICICGIRSNLKPGCKSMVIEQLPLPTKLKYILSLKHYLDPPIEN